MFLFFANEGGMTEIHPRALGPPDVLFLLEKVGMTGTSRAEPFNRLPKSCPHDSFLFFCGKQKHDDHARPFSVPLCPSGSGAVPHDGCHRETPLLYAF